MHWWNTIWTWDGWKILGGFSLLAAGISILADRFFGWRAAQDRRRELLKALATELQQLPDEPPGKFDAEHGAYCFAGVTLSTPTFLLDGVVLSHRRDHGLIATLLRLEQLATTYRDVVTASNLIICVGGDAVSVGMRQRATEASRSAYAEVFRGSRDALAHLKDVPR